MLLFQNEAFKTTENTVLRREYRRNGNRDTYIKRSCFFCILPRMLLG